MVNNKIITAIIKIQTEMDKLIIGINKRLLQQLKKLTTDNPKNLICKAIIMNVNSVTNSQFIKTTIQFVKIGTAKVIGRRLARMYISKIIMEGDATHVI